MTKYSMKTVCTGSKTFLYPRMVYSYNSVTKSLQLFLSRPRFWEKFEECRKQIFPDGVKTDIYQGNIWRGLGFCRKSTVQLSYSMLTG